MSTLYVQNSDADVQNGSYFISFAANNTSQGGEDGILAKLFELLCINENARRMCVEVGAWDGRYLSNTYSLLHDTDIQWDGVLIEADLVRSKECQALYATSPQVICVDKHVNLRSSVGVNNSENFLRCILKRNNVPIDFDFLSIDVDGADYHLWHQLSSNSPEFMEDGESYHPKVVCIEFNPTIPNNIYFVQECDTRVHQGNSLLALHELGLKLNYELIVTTTFNAIFVRKDYYLKFLYPELTKDNRWLLQSSLLSDISDRTNSTVKTASLLQKNLLDLLHPPSSMYTYMFQTYDGELKYCGSKKLIWHKLALNPQRLQIVAPKERKFPYEPQNEVLITEVDVMMKEFLSRWSNCSSYRSSVEMGDPAHAIVDEEIVLNKLKYCLEIGEQLLSVTSIRGRVMELLTVLVYTVNASYEAMVDNTALSNDNIPVSVLVQWMTMSRMRLILWMQVIYQVSSIFKRRGDVYFNICELHDAGSTDELSKAGMVKVEDVETALYWYRLACSVVLPFHTLFPLNSTLSDAVDIQLVSEDLDSDSLSSFQSISEWVSALVRSPVIDLITGKHYSQLTLRVSQCCRESDQLLESASYLSQHRHWNSLASKIASNKQLLVLGILDILLVHSPKTKNLFNRLIYDLSVQSLEEHECKSISSCSDMEEILRGKLKKKVYKYIYSHHLR